MKMYGCFLLVTLLAVAAQAQQGRVIQKIMENQFSRDAAPNTGPVPDYSNAYYWAALPEKHSPADSVPAFLVDEKRDNKVDVFFIHPTSYLLANSNEPEPVDFLNGGGDRAEVVASLKVAAWNANVDDTALNYRTDSRSILNQASAFNGSCRIFAPRYRQANIKAFFVPNSKVAQAAFDLAYSDVKRAFQYYLDHYNNGRPIIIASHSQGSLHAKRLLQDFFDGTPLQKQLVCAYVIGHQIETDAFKKIPVCSSPAATGCFVGWRTYQQGQAPKNVLAENGNSVCVNPLTWNSDTATAASGLNMGSLLGFNNLVVGKFGAGITADTHILWVTLPAGAPASLTRMKNMHMLDYNLFWMNIRQNVKARVGTYLAKGQ